MRGRSYSYSPSPPRRGYNRRNRSPSPRGGRYGGRGRDRDLPTSLLVRNLRHDCRTEDLRVPFGEFGTLKDVYLPRDYYTGEPRGFGFVQYVDPDDAAEAKYHMDGQTLLGRELTVVFAEENRKKPAEMRAKDRVRSVSYDRRSLSQYSSRYARSYSRSPDYYRTSSRRGYSRSISPYRGRSYSRSPYRYRERSYSRSPSPRYARRGRSYSRSPPYDDVAKYRERSPYRYRERSYSRSPFPRYARRGRSYSRSPPYDDVAKYRERSYSRSPVRGRSPHDY